MTVSFLFSGQDAQRSQASEDGVVPLSGSRLPESRAREQIKSLPLFTSGNMGKGCWGEWEDGERFRKNQASGPGMRAPPVAGYGASVQKGRERPAPGYGLPESDVDL